MSEPIQPSGPDLRSGVSIDQIPGSGVLVCQADGEPLLLVRSGGEVCAVGAACTHYGAPLADGALIDGKLHCPWHHACFDPRTGDAEGPPALKPLDTWELKREGDRVIALGKRAAKAAAPREGGPSSVVIVGAGAAGDAAAGMLRKLGYAGPISLLSRDGEGPPVDRPNLSKDYLDGSAPEEWIPLRGAEFYDEHHISRPPDSEVARIDPAARRLELKDGETLGYGALLLATGASPIRLELPGASLPHVHLLRTLPDSRGLIAAAKRAKRAVVIGASFIGLEAAASLRKRGLEVQVVAPETAPLARVLGPELGGFVRKLHEEKGVQFHLGRKPASIDARAVTLDDGSALEAELVVMGVGVRPDLALAQAAGLRVDRGVLVDAGMRTSAAEVYAAGDIARYPGPEGTLRVEHWAVAQRQGQLAARSMLGLEAPARWTPFFWSQHYDVAINYVGHAEPWDALEIAGSVEKRDCLVAYRAGGKIVAVATVFRDRESLLAEDALAKGDQAALEALLRG